MINRLKTMNPVQLICLAVLLAGILMIIVALCIQANEREQERYQSVSSLLEERLKKSEIRSNTIEAEELINQMAVAEIDAPLSTPPSNDANGESNEAVINPQSTSSSSPLPVQTVETIDIDDSTSGKININTANLEQLQTLKGIGPSKAAAIIADREKKGAFLSIDEIKRVKGIGEKLYAGIKESIVAEQ